MVNKKGIIKILEASIAILIILGVLLAVSLRQRAPTEQEVTFQIYPVLDEISKNTTLRNQVLSEDKESLTRFISSKLDPDLSFDLSICPINEVCYLEEHPGITNIYVAERVISSNLTTFDPKKIKIFVWRTQ